MSCIACGKDAQGNDLCAACYLVMLGANLIDLCNAAMASHRYEPTVKKIKELADGITTRRRQSAGEQKALSGTVPLP